MRSIFNFILLAAGLSVFLASCDRVDALPSYSNGTTPTLTASTTTIAPQPQDSNNVSLTLNWTKANHATDSNHVKYTIEVDSTGKNFANAATWVVTNATSKAFLAKELNTVLVNRGYAFNVPVDMDVRVTSSYTNNNERLSSNTLKIRMTPYKVPPKVPLPTSTKLFIVGDASVGGWNNPVPVPSQEFVRLDETTWAGVFDLIGGKEFLLLPENGNWAKKFALQDNTVAGINAGGSFGYHVDGQAAPDPYTQNFKGPATSGTYKIVLDFQQGKFTITPYQSTLPVDLFIVGDATAGGWNNPVPTPAQKFSRLNSSVWQITLPITGGKEFLVLTENGNWAKKFALKDNTVTGINAGGEFGYHVDGQPAPDDYQQNFKGPAASGNYTITLNFAAPTTLNKAAGKFTIQ